MGLCHCSKCQEERNSLKNRTITTIFKFFGL